MRQAESGDRPAGVAGISHGLSALIEPLEWRCRCSPLSLRWCRRTCAQREEIDGRRLEQCAALRLQSAEAAGPQRAGRGSDTEAGGWRRQMRRSMSMPLVHSV